MKRRYKITKILVGGIIFLLMLLAALMQPALATCISGGGLAGECFSDTRAGSGLSQRQGDWCFLGFAKFIGATDESDLLSIIGAEHNLITSSTSVFFENGSTGFTQATLGKLCNLKAVGIITNLGFLSCTFDSSFEPSIGNLFGCTVLEPPVPTEIFVDIKPQSCPNPLNTKSRGVLPVAILGTPTLDVTTIDPASIRLEDVAPIRSSIEDVATPFGASPEACSDCTTEGPDGFQDLTLKFDTQEVIDALGAVSDRECLVLTLTGNLKEEFGGTPIQGEDVVFILKKGK